VSILLCSMEKHAREKVRSTLLFRETRSKIERKRIVRQRRKKTNATEKTERLSTIPILVYRLKRKKQKVLTVM